MKTSLVIATHQRPALIERLLRNLEGCALPDETEVRIVENGPRCGVEAIARAHPLGGRVRYMYRPVGMKALALNEAIAASGADFLIFLDDDVGVPPGLIEAYVAAARRHGPGFFFGGGLTAEAETECPPHLAPYLPRSAVGWAYAPNETEIPPDEFDFFFGANWAAFRADLEACGLFARDLGISQSRNSSVGEETELQQRLVQHGMRPIYLPDAVIRHPVPAVCYTHAWVWRRRLRLGVTEWTLAQAERAFDGRKLFGAPLWLLRALLRQKLRLLRLTLRRAPLALRIAQSMEEARLTGLLYGALADHRRDSRSRRQTRAPRQPERPAAPFRRIGAPFGDA